MHDDDLSPLSNEGDCSTSLTVTDSNGINVDANSRRISSSDGEKSKQTGASDSIDARALAIQKSRHRLFAVTQLVDANTHDKSPAIPKMRIRLLPASSKKPSLPHLRSRRGKPLSDNSKFASCHVQQWVSQTPMAITEGVQSSLSPSTEFSFSAAGLEQLDDSKMSSISVNDMELCTFTNDDKDATISLSSVSRTKSSRPASSIKRMKRRRWLRKRSRKSKALSVVSSCASTSTIIMADSNHASSTIDPLTPNTEIKRRRLSSPLCVGTDEMSLQSQPDLISSRSVSTAERSKSRHSPQTSPSGVSSMAADMRLDMITLLSKYPSLRHINLKNIVNRQTFDQLPAPMQTILLSLLPECDHLIENDVNSNVPTTDSTCSPKQEEIVSHLRLHDTAVNNEFFAKALEDFRERYRNGRPASVPRVKKVAPPPKATNGRLLARLTEVRKHPSKGKRLNGTEFHQNISEHDKVTVEPSTSIPSPKIIEEPSTPDIVKESTHIKVRHPSKPSGHHTKRSFSPALSSQRVTSTTKPLTHTPSVGAESVEERRESLKVTLKNGSCVHAHLLRHYTRTNYGTRRQCLVQALQEHKTDEETTESVVLSPQSDTKAYSQFPGFDQSTPILSASGTNHVPLLKAEDENETLLRRASFSQPQETKTLAAMREKMRLKRLQKQSGPSTSISTPTLDANAPSAPESVCGNNLTAVSSSRTGISTDTPLALVTSPNDSSITSLSISSIPSDGISLLEQPGGCSSLPSASLNVTDYEFDDLGRQTASLPDVSFSAPQEREVVDRTRPRSSITSLYPSVNEVSDTIASSISSVLATIAESSFSCPQPLMTPTTSFTSSSAGSFISLPIVSSTAGTVGDCAGRSYQQPICLISPSPAVHSHSNETSSSLQHNNVSFLTSLATASSSVVPSAPAPRNSPSILIVCGPNSSMEQNQAILHTVYNVVQQQQQQQQHQQQHHHNHHPQHTQLPQHPQLPQLHHQHQPQQHPQQRLQLQVVPAFPQSTSIHPTTVRTGMQPTVLSIVTPTGTVNATPVSGNTAFSPSTTFLTVRPSPIIASASSQNCLLTPAVLAPSPNSLTANNGLTHMRPLTFLSTPNGQLVVASPSTIQHNSPSPFYISSSSQPTSAMVSGVVGGTTIPHVASTGTLAPTVIDLTASPQKYVSPAPNVPSILGGTANTNNGVRILSPEEVLNINAEYKLVNTRVATPR